MNVVLNPSLATLAADLDAARADLVLAEAAVRRARLVEEKVRRREEVARAALHGAIRGDRPRSTFEDILEGMAIPSRTFR